MKRSFVRILCLLVLSAAASTQAGDLRTVALTGQLVPTASVGDAYLNGLSSPALNDAGLTAFMGGFTNNISVTGAGIWSERAGGLSLLAAESLQAPGMPAGFLFTTNGNLQLQGFSNAGKTLFYGSAADNGGLGEELSGYWSERTGGPTPLALNGDQAPGAPNGIHFGGLYAGATFNNVGQTAFSAGLSASCPICQSTTGIWSDRSGSLAPVALENQQAAGLPIGVNYANLYSQPVINDLGRIAFVGGLSGSGVNNSNAGAIWSDGSGTLAPVARAGDHAPGAPAGVNFIFPGGAEINNAGKIAFGSALTDDGVSGNRGSGIWTDRSGTLTPVAKSGDQAPGLPAGIVFAGGFGAAINNANQIAFQADVSGTGVDNTNRSGIWSDASGSLALVARVGSQAPDLPTGDSFLNIGAPSFNDAGQVAFAASVSDGGLNKLSIWATNRTGQLHLIAREGDQLEVAPGDFRTIVALGYGLNNTGKSALNSSGQLAFMAYFYDDINSLDSYGVFVSNKVAGLPGDFNHDGTVDAADYVVWRKTVGSPGDYNAWRTHFGQTAVSGSSLPSAGLLSAAVPEPSSVVLLMCGLLVILASSRRAPTSSKLLPAKSAVVVVSIVAASTSHLAPIHAASITFITDLGNPPTTAPWEAEYQFIPHGVSNDGSVIAGEVRSTDTFGGAGGNAFVWTKSGGVKSLGAGNARAVSFDGSTVVGVRSGGTSAFGGQLSSAPFRWTQATGLALLRMPTGVQTAGAFGVSPDGLSVMIESGYCGKTCSVGGSGGHLYRWTQAAGAVPLGIDNAFGSGVSADGSVVVGSVVGPQAFRWTAATGAVGLNALDNSDGSQAHGVSADGSAVVGVGAGHALRWTEGGGVIDLGLGDAQAVSADGSVVVGGAGLEYSYYYDDYVTPFYWTPTGGMRRLSDVLTNDYGLDLTDRYLGKALAMSADGRFIVGRGYSPTGGGVWLVDLTVPEPSTAALLLMAANGFGLFALRRRRA